MNLRLTTVLVLGLTCLACDDDDTEGSADGGRDAAATTDAAAVADGAATADGAAQADGAAAADTATADAGLSAAAMRGQYLVTSVLGCGDCHTPRAATGGFDMSKFLAGTVCSEDSEPADPNRGCMNARNLTPHPTTGLGMRSAAEIKDMIVKGVRPDGKNLHPAMPYWDYGNLTSADADAIVAFLKEGVAPIDNMIGANQPPNDMPFPVNIPKVPDDKIPAAPAGDASALRGRYLAAVACVGCHTPNDMGMPPAHAIDLTKVFAGGRTFTVPVSGAVRAVYTTNLTQHANGLLGYTADDVYKVLKQGLDKMNAGVCPPMGFVTPGGPMGKFGRLTEQDARDLAAYISNLPANANMIPMTCAVPLGSDGGASGGADGGVPGDASPGTGG